jgi:plastocyanin domain-containing protein
MDKIVSLIVSAAAIGFILWWFFGKRKEEAQTAEQTGGVQQIEITVDGGYQPRVTQLKAGVPAKLVFNRKDPSACLEEILMPDFGVAQKLPHGQKTTIDIEDPKPGTYKYTCGMQMFSGEVVVK